MTDLKDHIAQKMKHPFWWAFVTSFLVMNYELFVYSVYEFEKVNLQFFNCHLKGNFDLWLLIPISVGLFNALWGQAIIHTLNTASNNLLNRAKVKFADSMEKRVVFESELNKANEDIESLNQVLASKNKEIEALKDQVTLANKEPSEIRANLKREKLKFEKQLKAINGSVTNAISASGSVGSVADQLKQAHNRIDELMTEIRNLSEL